MPLTPNLPLTQESDPDQMTDAWLIGRASALEEEASQAESHAMRCWTIAGQLRGIIAGRQEDRAAETRAESAATSVRENGTVMPDQLMGSGGLLVGPSGVHRPPPPSPPAAGVADSNGAASTMDGDGVPWEG